MTHLFPRPTINETFWLPISTGVAAHTSLETAAISAICELVERDAIALNWLTRRVLPVIREHGGATEYFTESSRSDTTFHFFDATTDVGVPTIYVIEEHLGDDELANVVACCTDFDWREARDGTIRELCSTRSALKHSSGPVPPTPELCTELEHGAQYMAQKELAHGFDFMKQSTSLASMNRYDELAAMTPGERISFLVDRIRLICPDLVLVDMTTDDLRDQGLFVVRAVAPGLVPMSTNYKYRYLGHPRFCLLYTSDAADE